MIIVIGSNKGGTGKTTTATNIAVALAKLNQDICLIDADFQRSTSKWYHDRESNKIQPYITLVEKYDNIASTLEDLNRKYSYVVVDVAGRNSREMITGMTVADILISPHQASQLDLDTVEELEEQITKIKDINPTLKSYILHTMASTNHTVRTKERNELQNYVSDYDNLNLINTSCYYRKIYRDVIALGKSVVETNNELAKNEIENLLKELFSDDNNKT